MKVDVILRGNLADIDLIFIDSFLRASATNYFSYPEGLANLDVKSIISIIKQYDYVDFYIPSASINIFYFIIFDVFVNVGVDQGQMETLLFLDTKDIYPNNFKEAIDVLYRWVIEFSKHFGIKYFRCQLDNGNEVEYYFDSNGYGPLYV